MQHGIAGVRKRENRRAREMLCAEIKHRKCAQRRGVATRVNTGNLRHPNKVLRVQLQIDFGVIAAAASPDRRRVRRHALPHSPGVAACVSTVAEPLSVIANGTSNSRPASLPSLTVDANITRASTRRMREDRAVQHDTRLPGSMRRKNNLTLIAQMARRRRRRDRTHLPRAAQELTAMTSTPSTRIMAAERGPIVLAR